MSCISSKLVKFICFSCLSFTTWDVAGSYTLCLCLGTDVLVLTTTDVDKSGASYYGEQTLQFISTSGESGMVQLGKEKYVYVEFSLWFPRYLVILFLIFLLECCCVSRKKKQSRARKLNHKH